MINSGNEMSIRDDTSSYTKIGALKFFSSGDFGQYQIFGKKLSWIKCIDINNIFSIVVNYLNKHSKIFFRQGSQISFDKTSIKRDFNNPFPKINSIYINTVLLQRLLIMY